MKKNLFYSTWYTVMMAGVVYTATIFVIIQRTKRLELAVLFTLLALQLIGLVYYLHRNPNKQESMIVRCVLRVLQLSVIGVIACFCIAVYGLANQYHNPVQPTATATGNENITLLDHNDLYIMYPAYQTVEFVSEKAPSRRDTAITFCCAAAFQQRYSLRFSHDEIASLHVESGKLYTGYELSGLGAFSFYDDTFHFSCADTAEDDLRKAAERGGYGFRSHLLIYNGEVLPVPFERYRCFRMLAEIDGQLCIVDSKRQMYLHDFSAAVKEAGAKNAIYLDMGMWSYSWYRDNSGNTNTLIGLPHPFAHNWLVFRK